MIVFINWNMLSNMNILKIISSNATISPSAIKVSLTNVSFKSKWCACPLILRNMTRIYWTLGDISLTLMIFCSFMHFMRILLLKRKWFREAYDNSKIYCCFVLHFFIFWFVGWAILVVSVEKQNCCWNWIDATGKTMWYI